MAVMDPARPRNDWWILLLVFILAAVRDIIYSLVVVRLFLLYFTAMFGYSTVSPFVPLRLQQLYLGPAKLLPTTIGIALTAAGIAMAVTPPLWGRPGDRIGRWYILPACIGAVAMGIFVEGVAPSILPVQVAFFPSYLIDKSRLAINRVQPVGG
jgi:MFS family permease